MSPRFRKWHVALGTPGSGSLVIRDEDACTIARVEPRAAGASPSAGEAASLIAAAPDMFEALRDLEVWLRSDESDPAFIELQERAFCAGVTDNASMVRLLGDRARAALARASRSEAEARALHGARVEHERRCKEGGQ